MLIVTDAEALAVLEREVGDFGRLVADQPEPFASTAELWSNPVYRSVRDVVVREVAAVARADRSAGVGIRNHVHRLFDTRWLRAPRARFELVAVSNRIDRKPFQTTACGETRLVYRLAYAACGGIAILSDFNDCLARREPFSACSAKHVRPAALRACSSELPCRDDYICARTATGGGACLPPYFVFQLRVDGHP